MSQPKGSVGVALAVAALIVIAVTSVGYYQFVYCTSNSCSTSTGIDLLRGRGMRAAQVRDDPDELRRSDAHDDGVHS